MTDWGFFVLPASLFFNGLAHLFVTLPFLFFVISTQGEIYLTATVCHPPSVFFCLPLESFRTAFTDDLPDVAHC
jgi:hypothetical protein